MAPVNQTLPTKDVNNFRQIVRCYEEKQYKKGVKLADSLLKTYPEHGETLCMKGLLLSNMGRQEEAFELARRGLKLHLQSHVCWHVLGLLYRSEKNYAEAMKCYKAALRFDPDQTATQQILRDLSTMQLHARELPGFLDTRKRMMEMKPTIKVNWVACALAEQLSGRPAKAVELLKTFDETFEGVGGEPVEISELECYKIALLEEAGQFEAAFNLLKTAKGKILDDVFVKESTAELQYRLGNMSEVEAALKDLLVIQPDNINYARAFVAFTLRARKTAPAYPYPPLLSLRSIMRGDCDELEVQVGAHSMTGRFASLLAPPGLPDLALAIDSLPNGENKDRLELLHAPVSEIGKFVEKYIRKKLLKGVPNIFTLLRQLYAVRSVDASEVLNHLLLSYNKLLADSALPSYTRPALLGVKALHLDQIGEHDSAIRSVDEAIEHTATLPDAYLLKAKILTREAKRVGDRKLLDVANENLETARKLDLSDRYLNTTAVKGLLRLDRISEAKEKVLLFSKETSDSKSPNLTEMQAEWWERHLAAAHWRRGEYGRALKSWNDTLKHFDEFKEDEFDFAQYCLRKCAIRAYREFLLEQEKIKNNKSFRTCASRLVRAYLTLHKAGFVLDPKKPPVLLDETLLPNRASDYQKEDSESEVFLKKDFLKEAQRVSSLLIVHCPKWAESHNLAFEVAFAQNDLKACVACLSKMKESDGKIFRMIEQAEKFGGLSVVQDTLKESLGEVAITGSQDAAIDVNGWALQI